MIPPLKPGATLPEGRWPRHRDRAADPAAMARWRHCCRIRRCCPIPARRASSRADGKPITTEIGGWRNAAVMSGHWALHGFGMFAVEEKSSGRYVGRVGPWCPPGWPGFEVGWGIAREFRGKGYAVEAARASIDWVVRDLRYRRDHPLHRSRSMRRRKPWRDGSGRRREGEIDLFGKIADVWVTSRDRWKVNPRKIESRRRFALD